MTVRLRHLNQLWGPPLGNKSCDFDSFLGRVSTDTRTMLKGDFFVPLVGEKYDGHNFLDVVLTLGAQGFVASRVPDLSLAENLLYWIVEDTTKAYQQLGLLHRMSLGMPVIAVTGSAGKTTTRELIGAALSPLGDILCSSENNNNKIGVPMTLLQGTQKHSAAVIEMGMRGLGEIEELSRFTQPDIAVITNIGNAHVGRLGSRGEIAKAKCEITSHLNPSGLVVIPYGDRLLDETLATFWNGRVKRVAISKDLSTLKDSHFEPDYIGNVDLGKGVLSFREQQFNLPLEGLHNARNLMLAIAVAIELEVSLSMLKDLKVCLPAGRSRSIQFGQLTILDETYNASPESVRASLELLTTKPGRHFAVLGAMLELGEYSQLFHHQIGEMAVHLELDGLVVVSQGDDAIALAKAANKLPRLVVVDSVEEAIKPLLSWLSPGDTLLMKASREVGLENLLNLLPNI